MIDVFLFILIIVKRADGTVVGTKVHVAAQASLRLGLDKLATAAFDVCYSMPIDPMIPLYVKHVLVHDLIMAEATRICSTLANWVRAL